MFIHFLCLSKENESIEKTLFLRYFYLIRQNRKKAPKFFPRFQKFLTKPSHYTEEKEQETLRVWGFITENYKPRTEDCYCQLLQLTELKPAYFLHL